MPETDGVVLSRRDGADEVKVEGGDGAPWPVVVVLEAALRRSEPGAEWKAQRRPAIHLGDTEVPGYRKRLVLSHDVQFDKLFRLGYVEVHVLPGIRAAELKLGCPDRLMANNVVQIGIIKLIKIRIV